MKKIKIKIGTLFNKLGINRTIDEISEIDGIYIKTPTNELTKIRGFIKKSPKDIYEYDFEGTIIKCSDEHLFQENNKTIKAKNCNFIDLIDGQKKKTSEKFIKKDFVYDISIDSPHLYVTPNGVIHHNTSLAHVIAEELNAEIMFINASLESNIDLLRDKIKGFVTTESWDNRPKIVVLDEADGLNERTTQPALRAFIEEYSKSARFILTANNKNKIIEPLQDRLMDFDFDAMFIENKNLIKDIFIRCVNILKAEDITYEAEDLKYLVKHYYPSQRSIVMKLQQFTTNKTLVINHTEMNISDVLEKVFNSVMNNEFEEMRKIISNITDPSVIFSDLYDRMKDFPQEKRPPILISIAKYQANDSFVRDRVINVGAMLTELMGIIRK